MRLYLTTRLGSLPAQTGTKDWFIMTNILDPRLSPSVGSYTAAPLSAQDIHEHVDCDRIWSTINAVRVEIEQREEEAAEVMRVAANVESEALAKLDEEPPKELAEIEAAFDALVASGYKQKLFNRLHTAIKG